MTQEQAIQQILDAHWNSKRHGHVVDELDVRCGVVANRAYEQGASLSIEKARLELDAAHAAARSQGRREGLEEAAVIALTEAAHLDGLNERMAKGADRVAIAIRARINQE